MWVTVNQAGQTAKKWGLRYYAADGKRQKARIGEYPDLSLAKAQALSEDMKKKAKEEGVNLAQEQAKARRVKVEDVQTERQNTFENVARAWLVSRQATLDSVVKKTSKEVRKSGKVLMRTRTDWAACRQCAGAELNKLHGWGAQRNVRYTPDGKTIPREDPR